MADTVVPFGASDLFALPAAFNEQNSSTTVTRERDVNLDASGDLACESAEFNVTTNYSSTYQYCGTTLVTDALTEKVFTEFGDVLDSKLVDSIEVSFGNKTQPEITISGHNHSVNPHLLDTLRHFDISAIVPDAGGVGVPAVTGVTVAATNAPQSASISAAFEHMDVEGADGDHFGGENRTCIVTLSMSGVGPASGITLASPWVADDVGDEDANTDPDSFSIAAHQYVDFAAAP